MFDDDYGADYEEEHDSEDREFDMSLDEDVDYFDDDDELARDEESQGQTEAEYELVSCAEDDAGDEARELLLKKGKNESVLKMNDDAERAFQVIETQLKKLLRTASKEKAREIRSTLEVLNAERNQKQLLISGLGVPKTSGVPKMRKKKDAQVKDIDYVVNTATFIPRYDDNRAKEIRELCPLEFWEDIIKDLKLEYTRKQFDIKKLEREYKKNSPNPTTDGCEEMDIDWNNDSCIQLMLENIDDIVTDDLELIYRPGADVWLADKKRVWRDWEYYMTPQWNWVFWIRFSRFVGNSYRRYSDYFVKYARNQTQKLPRNGKKFDRHQHFFFMLRNVRSFIDFYNGFDADDEKKIYIEVHYFNGISRKNIEELIHVNRGSINWTLDKVNEDFARVLISHGEYKTKAATLLASGLDKLKNIQWNDAIKQVDSEIKMAFIGAMADELADRLEQFEKWQRKNTHPPTKRKKV